MLWHEIQTAPTDGTPILGVSASGKYKVGHAYHQGPQSPIGVIDGMTGRWLLCTHWMTLPMLPNAENTASPLCHSAQEGNDHE